MFANHVDLSRVEMFYQITSTVRRGGQLWEPVRRAHLSPYSDRQNQFVRALMARGYRLPGVMWPKEGE
jgi:hypothetical protein